MGKKIKEKTVCSFSFESQMEVFLNAHDINSEDVIGISSKGDFTTLWYWSKGN